MNRKALKFVLPVLVLVLGALMAMLLIRSRPQVQTRQAQVTPPLVRVVRVQPEDLQLKVYSQGSVKPRTETTLVPQVSGRVLEVSSAFVEGGFFKKNEVLITIDPTDFELAVARARAQVAQAEVRLVQEEAEANVARREWEALGEGEGTPLAKREPQVLEARAGLEAAKATLKQAEIDLNRTRMRAPFAGRVRTKNIDIGQFVILGQRVAQIYATDFAEVRLPLPDEELAFVDLPLVYREESDASAGLRADFPQTILRARFAGRWHEWSGRVVRTEGEIDPQSRMVHAIVQVQDPYGRGEDPERPPLAAGLFVNAEILGRYAENVFVLPRTVMRGRDQLLIVDDENRLRIRTVEVLRSQRNDVIIRSGLQAGERVCLSPLAAVTDGMRVRTQDEDGSKPKKDLEHAPPETPVGRSSSVRSTNEQRDTASGERSAEATP